MIHSTPLSTPINQARLEHMWAKSMLGKPGALARFNTARAALRHTARSIRQGRPVTPYKSPKWEAPHFPITVDGIPCGVVIDRYTPGSPAIIKMDLHDCAPAEDAEVDWHLIDRKGYRAKWLESRADEEAITDECLFHIREGGFS